MAESAASPGPRSLFAMRLRRHALTVSALFLGASIAIHFTLGPAITTLAPNWNYPGVPEQAIAVVTFSHALRERGVPTPTPAPTPSPPPLKRTTLAIAPLKFREIGLAAKHYLDIHPPARKKVEIVVNHYEKPKPNPTAEAPLAAVNPPVKPPVRPSVTSARADTGGLQNELAGASVWGDDNPPRVLKLMPLTLSALSNPLRVRVEVEVDPDGNALGARVLQSSGDAAVDQAALDAARKSIYVPATFNGLPVHGYCIVEFSSASSAGASSAG